MPTKKEQQTTVVEEPEIPQGTLQTTGSNELAENFDIDSLFEENAGGGLQNLGAADFTVPFMSILQSNSPQINELSPKYVPGSRAGQIMNSVTSELIDGKVGFDVLRCGFMSAIVRWHPRESGGGLVAHYPEGDPILRQARVNEMKKLALPDGDILVETHYHYCLRLLDEGYPEFMVIGMSSTQLKKSRNWNTIMRSVSKTSKSGKVYNPPTYFRTYHIGTTGETKNNNSWYGWKIDPGHEITDVDIFKLAKKFSDEVVAGKVKVAAPQADTEPEAEQDTSSVF